MKVSIHAPTRGATAVSGTSITPTGSFNPRSHTGSDFVERITFASCQFQSTLPHGERQSARVVSSGTSWFQSTLPHGERRCAPSLPTPISCFNPRSHTGSDRFRADHLIGYREFQSTLPHGERHRHHHLVQFVERVSIHAPTRGATPRAACRPRR